MKGRIGIVLLALGIIVSASFGARNGSRHVEYRQAQALVDHAEGEAAVAAAEAHRDSIGLPPPNERLQQWLAVGGVGWFGGLGLIVVGAVLARLQVAEDNAGGAADATGRVDFVATLAAVQSQLADLKGRIADLEMDGDSTVARELIDSIHAEHLEPLVEARGQLIAKHGLAGFAEYFGTYSAAERNLNRCWSALTDGHAVVAREALDTSLAAFDAALMQYAEVDARG